MQLLIFIFLKIILTFGKKVNMIFLKSLIDSFSKYLLNACSTYCMIGPRNPAIQKNGYGFSLVVLIVYQFSCYLKFFAFLLGSVADFASKQVCGILH